MKWKCIRIRTTSSNLRPSQEIAIASFIEVYHYIWEVKDWWPVILYCKWKWECFLLSGPVITFKAGEWNYKKDKNGEESDDEIQKLLNENVIPKEVQ